MNSNDPLHPDRIAHADRLVRLAFRGLAPQDAYDLAFYGHLLTTDPAGRLPTFLGTNQRDTIRPVLQRRFRELRSDGLVVDLAAGDGSTVLPAIDADVRARFVIVDPSAEAVADYLLAIDDAPNLELAELPLAIDAGEVSTHPFWGAATEGGIDLALCVHGIYFMDPEAMLRTVYERLRPGGTAVIVYADEGRGVTGAATEHHLRHVGKNEAADAFVAGLVARNRLFSAARGAGTVTDLLIDDGHPAPDVTVEFVESSVFAPSLEGLSAIGLISGLAYHDQEPGETMNESKAAALLGVLAREPERVGFTTVVDQGDPRCGCFKAAQPQRVVAIRRPLEA